MNHIPLILVSAADDKPYDGWRLRCDYVRRLCAAGALTLIVPHEHSTADHADQLIARCDGLLLSGGGDLHPLAWGERALLPPRNPSPLRDKAELALCRAAIRAGKPVFGICRGLQLLNVACGGSLYQDITLQLPHALCHEQSADRHCRSHCVLLQHQTARILGKKSIRVNSHHHQAICRVADNLLITAHAEDGLCEGLSSCDGLLSGVQWHPECLSDMQPLFDSFVQRCRKAAAY